MRKFTDIFIERPVLATVVSLTLLVLGLRSIGLLPVLQYPRTQNAVVTVTTTYVGADPALVAGFITTPLENSIAQASGIDYMSSVSRQSVSIITAALRLNSGGDTAITEIDTDPEIGKVSIVGAGMRSHPGVAAKVFQTLAEKEINIEMISTSPIKISCVIRSADIPEAVRALHEAFGLDASAVQQERPIGQQAR